MIRTANTVDSYRWLACIEPFHTSFLIRSFKDMNLKSDHNLLKLALGIVTRISILQDSDKHLFRNPLRVEKGGGGVVAILYDKTDNLTSFYYISCKVVFIQTTHSDTALYIN